MAQDVIDFGASLRERAEAWIAENHEAMALFEKFALQAAARRCRFGIKLLAERVRWETNISWTGDFKINNSYTAYIARELVRRLPELRPFIQFRSTGDESTEGGVADRNTRIAELEGQSK